MTRFYFKADYSNGFAVTDEVGEEFGTLGEAILHARIVAHELSRNTTQRLTLSVHDEDGTCLESVPAAGEIGDEPPGEVNLSSENGTDKSIPSCPKCKTKLNDVVTIPTFAAQPGLIAYECSSCGY